MTSNRQKTREFLLNLCEQLLNNKITPIEVISERSFVQYNEGFYYKTNSCKDNDWKLYTNVHKHLDNLLNEKNISIYMNHIVFKFDCFDEPIYLGLNDNQLSIGHKYASINFSKIYKISTSTTLKT